MKELTLNEVSMVSGGHHQKTDHGHWENITIGEPIQLIDIVDGVQSAYDAAVEWTTDRIEDVVNWWECVPGMPGQDHSLHGACG